MLMTNTHTNAVKSANSRVRNQLCNGKLLTANSQTVLASALGSWIKKILEFVYIFRLSPLLTSLPMQASRKKKKKLSVIEPTYF